MLRRYTMLINHYVAPTWYNIYALLVDNVANCDGCVGMEIYPDPHSLSPTVLRGFCDVYDILWMVHLQYKDDVLTVRAMVIMTSNGTLFDRKLPRAPHAVQRPLLINFLNIII